jgi:hypothetical protein
MVRLGSQGKTLKQTQGLRRAAGLLKRPYFIEWRGQTLFTSASTVLS